MVKSYFYIIFIITFFASFCLFAQDTIEKRYDTPIEGFNFYPNPVTNGKIYITSKANRNKEIEIFDVLGYTVLQTRLNEKKLDVSDLAPGIYIIQIKEDEGTVTRKLIIK